jgi:hypothetical protein
MSELCVYFCCRWMLLAMKSAFHLSVLLYSEALPFSVFNKFVMYNRFFSIFYKAVFFFIDSFSK